MAPRVSSGVFPDAFITYDTYEAGTLPPAVPPPPPEQLGEQQQDNMLLTLPNTTNDPLAIDPSAAHGSTLPPLPALTDSNPRRNSMQQQQPHHHHHLHQHHHISHHHAAAAILPSVLDNETSMESDDDDDDDMPDLDQTLDSIHSSGVVTDAESHDSGGSDNTLTLNRNSAFSDDDVFSPIPSRPTLQQPPLSPNSILLSFGPNTTVQDLKYFAERGCIVALLQALKTPHLITLGTRMLADYAKMSDRRVAVASNRSILDFVVRVLQMISDSEWLGREYAVETIRSLTATEESDKYLMTCPNLLVTLALTARGGPFVTHVEPGGVRTTSPLASEKARLHACIAIMNLSCGKANKMEIAKFNDILEAMRDVMLQGSPEGILKATTCIKNLSNADANDASLLACPGLVEALGRTAAATCTLDHGATTCTTNACLALMNLSISKSNKHRVFLTPGVMDALMIVLERTTAQGSSNEARIKACSALSNLAIGYDNKIPMFSYPGFVDAILNVILTDVGEARTKACSILWSFAAEMKNQIPVSEFGRWRSFLFHCWLKNYANLLLSTSCSF
jgi:hypothetical protein